MSDRHSEKKLKRIAQDSVWSIAGQVLINAVIQFAVYPLWNRVCGPEQYGNILYLMALVGMFPATFGQVCNQLRLARRAQGEEDHSPYQFAMLFFSALMLPAAFLAGRLGGGLEGTVLLLFILLAMITSFGYYCDVDYSLALNYRGYFFYYLIAGIGYLLGGALFLKVPYWPLPPILGALAGFIVSALQGSALRLNFRCALRECLPTWKVIFTVFFTNLLVQLVFFADRLVLKNLLNGTAVTVYYLASLLGKTMALITGPLISVMMGYFARYKGGLSLKMMHGLTAAALGLALFATGGCVLAAHILIQLLYPNEYILAAPYFWSANCAQALYCITNVLTAMLLRFSKTRYQAYVNGTYATAFCVLAIPLTVARGIEGFCLGALAASLIRIVLAIVLGYRQALCTGQE